MEASVSELLMNLTWASRCLFCDSRLEPEKAFWVCDDCRDNMPELAELTCDKCGTTVELTWNKYIKCECCGHRKKNYLLPIQYFRYDDERVNDAIKKIKYTNATDKARPMAELMVANIIRLGNCPDFDYIVPMPTSKKRYHTRGFNQCELIAKEMSKLLKIKYNNKTLRKMKETPPQSTLNEEERFKNLNGSFGIYDEQFDGKNILLVDDISTTGTTINEACKTILKNGDANLVKAIVFAHT